MKKCVELNLPSGSQSAERLGTDSPDCAPPTAACLERRRLRPHRQQSVAERFGASHSEQDEDALQAAKDVDLRRGGLAKLQSATQTYMRNMSKRKDADTIEGASPPFCVRSMRSA